MWLNMNQKQAVTGVSFQVSKGGEESEVGFAG
jgi:hypothetical protein